MYNGIYIQIHKCTHLHIFKSINIHILFDDQMYNVQMYTGQMNNAQKYDLQMCNVQMHNEQM